MALQTASGNIDVAANGDIPVNIGFEPDIVFFMRFYNVFSEYAVADRVRGFGAACTADQQFVMCHTMTSGSRTGIYSGQSNLYCCTHISATGFIGGKITFKSKDLNGFVVTAADVGPMQVKYLAIKGGNWKISNFNLGGAQTIINVPIGFEPTGVSFFTANLTTASAYGQSINSCIGFWADNAQGLQVASRDRIADNNRWVRDNAGAVAMHILGNDGSIYYRTSVTGKDSSGVELTTTGNEVTYSIHYIACSGLDVHMGQYNQPVTDETLNVTDVPFKPEILLQRSIGSDVDLLRQSANGFGFADALFEAFSTEQSISGNNSSAQSFTVDDCISELTRAAPPLKGNSGTLSQFTTNGFDIDWTIVDGNPNRVNYMALADAGGSAAKSNPLLFGQDF